MKENDQTSSDPKLSALLREHRAAPALPPRFQQNVWRRIEDAGEPVMTATWIDAIANLILRPRFAVAVAAVVLIAGVLAGSIEGRHLAQHDAQMNYVASVMPHVLR